MHKYNIYFTTTNMKKGIYYYTETVLAKNKIDAINKILEMINDAKDSLKKIYSMEKVY